MRKKQQIENVIKKTSKQITTKTKKSLFINQNLSNEKVIVFDCSPFLDI